MLALAAVFALGGSVAVTPHAAGQTGPTVGLDMDIAGNDDSTIGAVQDCAELAQVGDTLAFDLFIKNLDSSVRIKGYQFDIDYDPSVIQINSVIDRDPAGSEPPNNVSIISRIPSGGGAGFLTLTEGPLPDTDGSFTIAVIDGTGIPTPPDNHEYGEGVLARITIEAVGTGRSNLIIPGPSGGPDGNPDMIILGGAGQYMTEEVAVGELFNGALSVGTSCAPPPPPIALPGGSTPSGGGTTGGTTDETTDGTGPQTQPGTPAGETDTGTGATNGNGQTQGAQTPGAGGSSTPTLGGTPISDGAGGDAQTAQDGDGGGLSTAAWIGIGIVAVLLAAGGGWFAYQRRRAGPQ